MNILYIVTSGLFFLWIIRNILFWVALWQTKEYRLDRVLAHLAETQQGRNTLFSPLNLLKIAAIVSYLYVVVNDAMLPLYALLIMGIYLFEFFSLGSALITHRLKRPIFTGKALLLLIGSFLAIFGLYTLGLIQQEFLWLLILDKITPLVIAFFVFFLSVPTTLFQDYRIEQAIKRIRKFPHILVIGVTGSFGKSSTKEYTAQILSKKFIVAKTKGTNNTPIGIANTIFSQIQKNTEVFVVEMGAYKRGEIAELCEIVQPKIGILTAVAMQHLSLFGSAENLAKTKYELIESLPADGIALFNGNNEALLPLYKQTKMKKALYEVATSQKKKDHAADIIAQDIKVEKNQVKFTASIGNKTMHLTSPLIGIHMIENVLPGIYIADYLGMRVKEIQEALASLKPLPQTMIRHVSLQGTTLIDDTFNVNPDGVIAAMEYAQLYKGKKILVLEPMIELGSSAGKEHYRVGKALAHHCDYLFLTKKNYYPQLLQGILDEKGTCILKVAKAAEIVAFINDHTDKHDIVVFEGKEAAVAMNKIV